ncbi:MAG: hypothetical protein U9R15_08260 [Chloroflexota bacterium]|nr:hypothetical protein [Chloroflexota bacterium]
MTRSRTTIDRLSINLSYTEPSRHWRYERATRSKSTSPTLRRESPLVWAGGCAMAAEGYDWGGADVQLFDSSRNPESLRLKSKSL